MNYRTQISLLVMLMMTILAAHAGGPSFYGDIFDTLTVNIGHRYVPNIPFAPQPMLRTLARTSSFVAGALGLSICCPQFVPFLSGALATKMRGILASTIVGAGAAAIRAGAIRGTIALVCRLKFKNPLVAITVTVKPQGYEEQAYARVRDLLMHSCIKCYLLPMCAGVAVAAFAGAAYKYGRIG